MEGTTYKESAEINSLTACRPVKLLTGKSCFEEGSKNWEKKGIKEN